MTTFTRLFGLTLWIAASLKCAQANETSLAIKSGVQEYTINVKAKNYMELVKTSTVFVDNTLFIKQVLEFTDQIIFMICPPKWGKTTNLHMLKSFLEMKVDNQGEINQTLYSYPSFKLFREGVINNKNGTVQTLQSNLMIANHTELIKKFQARHPVIYVSFKDAVGGNYTMIEKKLRSIISKLVGQFSYMTHIWKSNTGGDYGNAYTNQDRDKYNRLINQNVAERLSTALKFLSRVLRDHYKKKVFLFLDDYDAPLLNALHDRDFPPRDLGRLLFFTDELFTNTFLGNSHLYKAIITGTFLRRHSRWSYYGYEYIADRSGQFNKFFGFSRANVDELFNRFSVTGELSQQAHLWYGGHLDDFYMPWSIVNFLNEQKIAAYRNEIISEPFIEHQLNSHCHCREILLKLLSDKTISVVNEMPIDEASVFDMKKSYISFTTYLSENGYLTKIRGIPDVPVWTAKVPNREMKHIISNWLIRHCHHDCLVPKKVLQHVSQIVLDVFTNSQTIDATLLQETLQIFYSGNHSFDKSIEFSEELFLATFECVLVQMQQLSRFQVDVYYQELLIADIVVAHNETQQATIIELDYDNESANEAVERARKHERVVKKYTNLKTIRFLGINLSRDRNVEVVAKFQKSK